MRHRKSFNHLGRTSSHRKAMLSNMATSLILHKRITTTVAKAKALRSYIEPLITRSKDDTTHSRRIAFSYLQSKEAVTELFREVAKKVGDRPGGYTRIIKLGNRVGDNADMAMMELVDYNETLLAEKSAAKGKSKRRRRGGKKKTTETAGQAPVASAEETKPETNEPVADEQNTEAGKEQQPEAKAESAPETDKAEKQKETAPKAEDKTDAGTGDKENEENKKEGEK